MTGAGVNGRVALATTLSAMAGIGHNVEGLWMNPYLGMMS
jgi:hypothetical protein